jgi:hypothetical protein
MTKVMRPATASDRAPYLANAARLLIVKCFNYLHHYGEKENPKNLSLCCSA